MKIHASITQERLCNLIENEDHPGICIFCGEDAEGVEPDAEAYDCDDCGKPGVYGVEQLILMTA